MRRGFERCAPLEHLAGRNQQRASLDAATALAAETAARLKPLVARAGAVINGYDIEKSDDMTTGEQQATVDALLER